jgi:hypothetical protein
MTSATRHRPNRWGGLPQGCHPVVRQRRRPAHPEDPDPLPDGCTRLLDRPDPDIPNIVECKIKPGLAPQQGQTVELAMFITDKAPATPFVGRAIVTPVAGSPDQESFDSNNIGMYGIQVISKEPSNPDGEAPDRNEANAYTWTDNPQLSMDHGRAFTIHVGNRGAFTRGDVRVTFVTPFFVDFESSLPPGCSFVFQNEDPTIPEVASCTIPPGLGSAEVIIQLPLTLAPGSSGGYVTFSAVIVMPAPENELDTETDMRDNIMGMLTLASA